MKIIILAGGNSRERDVSLSSGYMISEALVSLGLSVGVIDPYRGIKDSEIDKLFDIKSTINFTVSEQEPDIAVFSTQNSIPNDLIGENVIEICKSADIVFIALHGGIGENGKLQATLDNYNIKYTGSGYEGSSLAMDKDISKRLVKSIGIPTPDWTLINTKRSNEIFDSIILPCFLKPTNEGSSIGVQKIHTNEELLLAIETNKIYGDYIIAEQIVTGREFSVGILDDIILPIIEIIPSGEFYDYRGKYQSGVSKEICPADLKKEQMIRIEKYASRTHEILRLGGYSRIDFMMDEYGEFFFLEANTLPGMTPTSLFPQQASVAGIDFPALCNEMIQIAIKKYN